MKTLCFNVALAEGVQYPTDKIVQLTQHYMNFVALNETDDISGVICNDSSFDDIAKQLPVNTPILTESEWHIAAHLDRFLIQLYTQDRLNQLNSSLSHHQVIQFHSRYKYLLMAYSPKGYQLTGKMVANIQKNSILNTFFSQYREMLMAILSQTPERKLHVNAIRHVQGYFKKMATSDEKKQLDKVVNGYLEGHLSINAPIEMLNHLLNQYPNSYLSEQYYLSPYPKCEKIRSLA